MALVMTRIIPFLILTWLPVQSITFDDSSGYEKTFDGIGGLSAGASSKLLVNYPEPYRNQILDYLFKPNFGASLQILKVEIGGDVQSTDGTEASHMHNSNEENYERGYEWWLMKEAKKRNPNIKLYGLPWGFPAWIGEGTGDAYHNVTKLADYVVRWINAAQTLYGLTIDYIGIWNQMPFNVSYIKTLRKVLDERGYHHTQIIVSDHKWEILSDLENDPELRKAVYGMGVHYPSQQSKPGARKLGMKLWASEDYCQINSEKGGACWARLLNRNYVNGYFTLTIAWTLIASYYKGLPGWDMGIMTAKEPWNGHYVVAPPTWASAHTTQFTEIGWSYLKHGQGVGTLPQGGTYVGLASPGRDQFTIIMETMTFEHSQCVFDAKIPFNVNPQNVTLSLKGRWKGVQQMNMWLTQFGFDVKPSIYFEKRNPVKFTDGTATLFVDINQIITLTTLDTGLKGEYPTPPPHVEFPLPYHDNFDGYKLYQEPYYLSQQTGSFEILTEDKNSFVRQMVTEKPIRWVNCAAESTGKAYNVFGENAWKDVFVSVDFRIPTVNGSTGVFVGARAQHGGCSTAFTRGLFFFALQDRFLLSADLEQKLVLATGELSYSPGSWHSIAINVKGNTVTLNFDEAPVFSGQVESPATSGWATLGTDNFGLADFDNLMIDYPHE